MICIAYAFVCHIIFNSTKEMIVHFNMSRETITHFLYAAKEDYTLFWYFARGVYALFWHVARSVSARFVRKKNARKKAAIRKILGFCASGDNEGSIGDCKISLDPVPRKLGRRNKKLKCYPSYNDHPSLCLTDARQGKKKNHPLWIPVFTFHAIFGSTLSLFFFCSNGCFVVLFWKLWKYLLKTFKIIIEKFACFCWKKFILLLEISYCG